MELPTLTHNWEGTSMLMYSNETALDHS